MKIEDVVAELMVQPLDAFTPQRNARAKELKASGEAELASQVAKLKKPSVALWAADRVALGQSTKLDELKTSADELARVQATSGRDAAQKLRAASDDFQADLDALATAATDVLTSDGHTATEDTLRRIREIFRLAALQGGTTWERLQKGALLDEPRPADDVLSMFQAGAATAEPARKPTAAERREEASRVKEAADRQANDDAQRAEQAEATARRLRAEAREAAAAAERADQRAKAAEEEAQRARAQAKKSAGAR